MIYCFGQFDLVNISFKPPNWAHNCEATRWFLTLPIHKPHNSLNRLLNVCNTVATCYNLPRLYSEQKPAPNRASGDGTTTKIPDLSSHIHVSIGWTLIRPPEQYIIEDKHAPAEVEKLLDQVRAMKLAFDTVKVKIGNVITSVNLNKTEDEKAPRWLGG